MTATRQTVCAWIAFAVAMAIVLVEIGADTLLPGSVQRAYPADAPVGWGIGYLVWLDGIVAFALLLQALNYAVPNAVLAKVQAVASLLFSLLLVLGAVLALLVAIGMLLTMVTLFLAAPFGTIFYLGKWGAFPEGAAAATLGLIFALKLGWMILLLIASPGFLGSRMLVVLALLSLGASAWTSFLHGFPPGFLVAIVDVVAAIVSCVVGILWGIVLLLGALTRVLGLLVRTAGVAVDAAT